MYVYLLMNLTHLTLAAHHPQLRKLSMADNGLSALPDAAKQWKELVSIDVRNNKIGTVEGFLEHWTKVY